ncbi:MAG: hypothetical protein JWO32_2964 [Bacteroidetes bacterium]|nr:hypothetical protein [Bacteroidota bacterium]
MSGRGGVFHICRLNSKAGKVMRYKEGQGREKKYIVTPSEGLKTLIRGCCFFAFRRVLTVSIEHNVNYVL